MQSIDDWQQDVRSDFEWMATEAADIIAKRDPDGLMVIDANKAHAVLHDLLNGHSFDNARMTRGAEAAQAALRVFGGLLLMSEELERVINSEADLRLERACERMGSAA